MSTAESGNVADTRALITETERSYLAGDGTDERRWQAASRVRSRIEEELTTDVRLLERHHTDLLDELREVVCADTDATPDVPGERRVVCDVCGWDGGTYSYTTTTEPDYCPGCGREIDDDSTRSISPEREPTALTFESDEIDSEGDQSA